MVNRHRAYWSSMSTGKYDFEPDKLDQDFKKHQERYNNKKEAIKAMVIGAIENEPERQDETFQMFIEVLREWRQEN